MNGKQLITYAQIAEMIKSYIKTNCKNYVNLNKMQAYYKNGHTATDTIAFGSYVTLGFTRKLTNSVTAVSEATINNDMNSFLRDIIKIAPYVDCYVNDTNFHKYLCNMAVFCITKLGIMTSNNFGGTKVNEGVNPATIGAVTVGESNVNTTLVYMASNNSYKNIIPMTLTNIDSAERTMYSVSDINTQFNAILNSISNTGIKSVSNKYTFSIALQ